MEGGVKGRIEVGVEGGRDRGRAEGLKGVGVEGQVETSLRVHGVPE